ENASAIVPTATSRRMVAACLYARTYRGASSSALVCTRSREAFLGGSVPGRQWPAGPTRTSRTCYLVADKFGFANCQTVAPPALGDMQKGRAAVPGGTAAAQSCAGFRRQSVKAAAARISAVTTPRRLRTGRNTDRR